ncbi:MAG: hypothetical protein IT289_02130 [Oligoflexia bacterium]|nr:hypothetical protein [Oligoflexia bacterium]
MSTGLQFGLVLLILVSSLGLPAQAATESEEVELNRICNCVYSSAVPYKKRRGTWGAVVGAQASAFKPVNYVPDFRRTQVYDTYYTSGGGIMPEATLGLKFNFFLGSLVAGATYGSLSATNETDRSTITVSPATATVSLYLDNFFNEPYVVPYGFGGMYTVFYKESVGGLSVSGNSPFAPVVGGGLMFQMDWIDNDGNDYAYNEYGLENTYLYVEARMFLDPGSGPDFSTPLQLGGGMKLEF